MHALWCGVCVCVVVGTLHVHYITCKSLCTKADVMSLNKKEKGKITTTKTRTCEKTKKKGPVAESEN